jgi:hypothetical protein
MLKNEMNTGNKGIFMCLCSSKSGVRLQLQQNYSYVIDRIGNPESAGHLALMVPSSLLFH